METLVVETTLRNVDFLSPIGSFFLRGSKNSSQKHFHGFKIWQRSGARFKTLVIGAGKVREKKGDLEGAIQYFAGQRQRHRLLNSKTL